MGRYTINFSTNSFNYSNIYNITFNAQVELTLAMLVPLSAT